MNLLTCEEASAKIREYVASREWWIIPWVSGASGRISQAVEEHIGPSDNFQVLYGGSQGVWSFARKSSIGVADLQRLMKEAGASIAMAVMDADHDILIGVDPADETMEVMARAGQMFASVGLV